jgi:peptidoglycan/xylan/chitin deacetylase (PgdA/CDA1 family)
MPTWGSQSRRVGIEPSRSSLLPRHQRRLAGGGRRAARALEQQLEWLVDQGFMGLTFHDAVLSPTSGKVAAVTFDYGHRSVLDRALPILSRLGLPGTVFVPTDFIDDRRARMRPGLERWAGGPHRDELTPLSWDELRQLSVSGWEIGSHSSSHPDLTRVDDASLRRQLERSRAACAQELGVPCRSLAYPYGSADRRVVCAARDAGYVAAGLLSWRLPPPTPLAWLRVGIFRRDGCLGFRPKFPCWADVCGGPQCGRSSILESMRCDPGGAENCETSRARVLTRPHEPTSEAAHAARTSESPLLGDRHAASASRELATRATSESTRPVGPVAPVEVVERRRHGAIPPI